MFSDGEMPIHMGCRLRSISHLNFLVAESEVNCQNKKTGDTPLHIAAKYGYKDVAEILLKVFLFIYIFVLFCCHVNIYYYFKSPDFACGKYARKIQI